MTHRLLNFLEQLSGLVCVCADALEFLLQLFQIVVGELLEIDEVIACAADGPDQLVQLRTGLLSEMTTSLGLTWNCCPRNQCKPTLTPFAFPPHMLNAKM